MSASIANRVHINADFGKILANYPGHKQLPPTLQKHIDDLNKPFLPNKGPHTSCCLQVCHAFNQSGIKVPPGNFRPVDPKRVAVQIPGKSGVYYLQAVDEMINYLTGKFPPEPIVLGAGKSPKSASTADVAAFTEVVRGLEGVMTFGNGHVELWNRYNIVQDSGSNIMDAGWVWKQSPVRFWRIGSSIATPYFAHYFTWFNGWWDVNDGGQYYYYVDVNLRKVTYTKIKPANIMAKPPKVPLNTGDITITGNEIVLDWDPADSGATRETFAFNLLDPTTMRGRSNRYANLIAKKMS